MDRLQQKPLLPGPTLHIKVGGNKIGGQICVYSAEEVQEQTLLEFTAKTMSKDMTTMTVTFACMGPKTVVQKGPANMVLFS